MTVSISPRNHHSPRSGVGTRAAGHAAASQFLADSGTLALQVSGPGRPARLVRLRSPKCTVGSGAGCTLRLRADGVDALHCWILRGEAGTVIRCLGGAASLNGTRFDEALLSIGDRVALGTVELVVVECSASLPIEQIPIDLSAQDAGVAQVLQSKLDAALEQIKRLEVQSKQGFESSIMAAERADQLRDALAETNQQLEEVCGDLNLAQETMAARNEALETQAAKLASVEVAERSARGTISKLEQQAATATAQCELLTTQVNELQTALTLAREELAQERQASEQRCAALQSGLQSTGSELATRSEAATIVFQQHSAAKTMNESQLNELNAQLADRQATVESLQQQLASQAAVAGRLEQLTCDFDQKCRQLADLQHDFDELSRMASEAEELQKKAQACEAMQSELSQREATLASATAAFDIERANFASKAQQLEATRDELIREQQRLADLNRQLEQSQASSSDLGQQRADLQQQRNQLEQQHNELEQQRTELEQRSTQLESRLSELESQAAEFNSRTADLEGRSAELNSRAAEAEQRAAEAASRAVELNQLLEQLVDQRATVALREQEIAARQAECESRLEAIQVQAAELANLRDELRARAEQLSQEEATFQQNQTAHAAAAHVAEFCQLPLAQAELCQEPAIAPEIPPESCSVQHEEPAPAPTDEAGVNSVLSRLVQAGVWRQDQNEVATPVQEAEVASTPFSPTASVEDEAPEFGAEPPANMTAMFEAPSFPRRPMQAATASDDEESIESYMDRLMKRVRGDAGGQSGWKSSAVLATPASQPAPEPAAAPEAVEAVIEAQPTEFSPRRTAPELTTDLSAMRDLANSAARTAIDQHVRQHTSRRAKGRLLGACLTVSFSAVLAIWAWRIHSFQAAIGAGVGGAIGIYWTLAALRRLSGLRRLDRETAHAAKAEATAADLTKLAPPHP